MSLDVLNAVLPFSKDCTPYSKNLNHTKLARIDQ